MPFGINNATNVTYPELVDIINITTNDPMMFFINVNHTVYNGWLYFLLLITLWIILVFAAQQKKDQLAINIMYSGAAVSMISFFLRAITILKDGVILGLLTDFQMWLFPLITIMFAVGLYATKNS